METILQRKMNIEFIKFFANFLRNLAKKKNAQQLYVHITYLATVIVSTYLIC